MAEHSAAHATPSTGLPEMMRPSSHWTAWGQWLALFTMTVDHLTRYVLPDAWTWAGQVLRLGALPFRCLLPWWLGTACSTPAARCATRAVS